jgi:hypothetical protein
MSDTGWVYIVLAGKSLFDAPRCKIGFTKGNPRDRLKTLQCGSPVPLSLFRYMQGKKEAERIFHETFAPLRLHGEWFSIEGKLHSFLCYLDGDHDEPVSGEDLLVAICDVVLSDVPPHPSIDAKSYAASADTKHWDSLREPLAADKAEGRW